MASKSDNTENGSGAATPEAAGGYSSLTTREQEILAKAMTCLKTSPEIDFPQLAEKLDMKNPRSAVNAWSQIKKKMGWRNQPSASTTPGKGPATGKRKMAVLKEDEADDDEEDAAPTKRAKVAPAPKSRKKAASATPKKGKAAAAAVSPAAVKDESEEDNVSSEDKADTKAGVKEEQVNGEV